MIQEAGDGTGGSSSRPRLELVPGNGQRPPGELTARSAGLRYVSDTEPGIQRRRAGKGFVYRAPDGSRVSDPATLQRIRSLAIPPAWTGVWIYPRENGHIQATGRDQQGRKQYIYHPRWREVRDETKYDRMIAFAEALPQIRTRAAEHLSHPGLPREKVLATVVLLLERTYIRVGNEEYARTNHSYGLTTLHNEHVEVHGAGIRFHFRGKSGVEHDVGVRDRRLARVIRSCQSLPGQELFQYVDEEGHRHAVTSCDVNDFLRGLAEQDFTAKDFRTWAGTLLAFHFLRDCPECETASQAKKNVVQAVKLASQQLGNTPAVCRKCYVHPAVLETYLQAETRSMLAVATSADASEDGLSPDERLLLEFLRNRQAKPAAGLHREKARSGRTRAAVRLRDTSRAAA